MKTPRRAGPVRSRTAQRGGFTLLEVLIAVTIIATMMSLVFGSLAASNALREAATERYDRVRAVQVAMRRMQREISMAFVTKIGQVPTNEQQEETYITVFQGRSDRLDFSNFGHLRTRVDEVASEQAEISYFLRSNRTRDGRLRQDLMRREQAPIDGDPENGGVIYTLLEDVESIEFEYWEPDREIAGDAWEREWDTTDTDVHSLPSRVRITIEVPHPFERGESITYTGQAEIHLQQPIGFVTQSLSTQQLDELDLLNNDQNGDGVPDDEQRGDNPNEDFSDFESGNREDGQ